MVHSTISLHNGCETAVSFHVQVAVYQESVLSSLLFVIAMNVVTEDVRDGSLMELLYVDGLIMCGKSYMYMLMEINWYVENNIGSKKG